MIRVLVADGHAIVRESILRLLKDEPRIQVLGEASNLPEAISKSHDWKPDVLLMDLDILDECSRRPQVLRREGCGNVAR